MMKHSGISGQNVARKILPLLLIVLPFWNQAGGSLPPANQQEQATETASPAVTDTVPPSATASIPVTETLTLSAETATLTFESPTATVPAASTTAELAAGPPISDQTLGSGFASGEVLARFRKQASRESIEQCIRSINASVITDIEELNTFVLAVPVGGVAQSIFQLKACRDLRYVEPNYLVQIADIIPSDPGWGNQYGLVRIRAPQGWEMNTGSSSVTIAIIDTGIDLTHLDLAGKLVSGIDIYNGDNNPQDDNGHGTHVAGIAAALSNNGAGVAGVSWGARLMPVKVLNAGGGGTYAGLAAGIIWAANHGAQIINLSLGGQNPDQTLQGAVDYAASRGVLLVAAAGNYGTTPVLYPARYPNVIAVAATNSSNTRAAISNYGPEVDLSAPGISIYSTVPGGYGYRDGTSMAAQFGSGLAAIMFGIPGNGSAAAVTQQMQSTALDLGSPGWDDFYGYGLIQMDAAIGTVLQIPTQTVTFTATSIPPLLSQPPGGGPSLPGLPGVGSPVAPDPSATVTEPYPASETITVNPVFTSTGTSAAGVTEDPEVFALETPDPGLTKKDQDWILPCSGSFLILLGIFLFWLARNDRRTYHRRIKRFR